MRDRGVKLSSWQALHSIYIYGTIYDQVRTGCNCTWVHDCTVNINLHKRAVLSVKALQIPLFLYFSVLHFTIQVLVCI